MFKGFVVGFVVVMCVKCCLTHDMPEDWIDPFDMSPSKDYLQYSDGVPSMHAHFIEKNTGSCSLAELYFKRTINMLLNSVHEDFIDPDVYSGHLFFKIDAEKYAILKDFADGNINEIEKVDKILGDILNKPTHKFLQEYLEGWFHKGLNFLLSREVIIAIVIASYVFVIFKIFHTNLYSWNVCKFLLINFFMFDFVFTWVHLYQRAQAEDIAQRMKYQEFPVECTPEFMNSWQFLASFLSKEDTCLKYYEVKYQDIFYKVSPGVVLTEIFTRTIQYPAKSIGKAFGELCAGMYGSFPWPLNIIILPMLLLFFCLFTCILLSLLLNKRIGFNLFHLISFSFGGESASGKSAQDKISGANLEKLLNITQKPQNTREFVEVIKMNQISSEINRQDTEIEDVKAIKAKRAEIKKQDTESEDEKAIETKSEKEVEIENVEVGSGDHL